MKLNIGNNNTIKKSIIGNKNNIPNKKENKFLTIIIEIVIGVIIAGIAFLLGWS